MKRWTAPWLLSLLLCSAAFAGTAPVRVRSSVRGAPPYTGAPLALPHAVPLALPLSLASPRLALSSPPQRLLMIGGGPRPIEALDKFVDWAGGDRSRLLVVTWASEEPEESFKAISEDLRRAQAGRIIHAPSARAVAHDPEALRRQLDRATAVFFSGGDQNRLMRAIFDLGLGEAFRRRYQDGMPFGGTSAGTAVMSALMIAGGEPLGTAEGLGLIEGVVVDQHFIRRQRLERLISVIRKETGLLGIGIDEGSALLVERGRHAEAVGPSPVTLVKYGGGGRVGVSRVPPGARFELP